MSKILVPNGYLQTEEDILSTNHIKSISDRAGEEIERLKNYLRMMAIATPRTFVPKGENVIDFINERVDNIVSDLLEQGGVLELNNLYDTLLSAWKYAGSDENYRRIDTDTEEGFNRVVINEKNGMGRSNYKEKYPNYFDLRNLNNVMEYLRLCDNTQDAKREPDDMWVIYVKGEMLVKEDGVFYYATEEAARKAFIDHIGLHDAHNIFTRKWMRDNPSFINDFLSHFYKDEEKYKRLKECADHIINDEQIHFDELNDLCVAFDELAWNKLIANGYDVKFVNIRYHK